VKDIGGGGGKDGPEVEAPVVPKGVGPEVTGTGAPFHRCVGIDGGTNGLWQLTFVVAGVEVVCDKPACTLEPTWVVGLLG